MPTETRCDCFDLPVESCGKAAEQKQRKQAAQERQRLAALGWFPASYPGTCKCGEPFDQGDLIVMDLAARRWIAACCENTRDEHPLYGRIR